MSQIQFLGTTNPDPTDSGGGWIDVNYGSTKNISFSHSSGTLTVHGIDGTSLSASNPGYVTMFSNVTAGALVTFTLTANVTLTVSDLTGNTFGTTASVAWGENMPLYVCCFADSTDDNLTFALCRLPNLSRTPVNSTDIGDPSAANGDSERSVVAFSDITEADFTSKLTCVLGAVPVQKDSSDVWTVQTFTPNSGLSKWLSETLNFVPGQNGAASGKYFGDNSGTAPGFATNVPNYYITKEGVVWFSSGYDNCNVAGVGAVALNIAVPYTFILNEADKAANGSGIYRDNGAVTGDLVMSLKWEASSGTYRAAADTYNELVNSDIDSTDDIHFCVVYCVKPFDDS